MKRILKHIFFIVTSICISSCIEKETDEINNLLYPGYTNENIELENGKIYLNLIPVSEPEHKTLKTDTKAGTDELPDTTYRHYYNTEKKSATNTVTVKSSVNTRPVSKEIINQTKAAFTGTTYPTSRDMVVSARIPGESSWYFEGTTFTKSGTYWSADKYWPIEEKLNFIGYNCEGLTPSSATFYLTGTNYERITLDVDNTTVQSDIVFFSKQGCSSSSNAEKITFKHAQALLIFSAIASGSGDWNGTRGIQLTGITVNDVYMNRYISFTNDNGTTSIGSSSSTAYNKDLPGFSYENGASYYCTSDPAGAFDEYGEFGLGGYGLLVYPQSSTSITVHYTLIDGSNTIDKEDDVDLTGITWQEGYQYEYQLYFDGDTLMAELYGGDVDDEDPYIFGDVKLSKGPLKYTDGEYVVTEDWTENSYNSVYGKNEGSTYFNYIEIGELFEKTGFSTSDGCIETNYDHAGGWRLPTKKEWEKILTNTTTGPNGRPGSTVNGYTNKHYAFVRLTGVTHCGTSTPRGMIIFPDNETITGAALSYMDNINLTTGVTVQQINNFIEQGCVFLPQTGFYNLGWTGQEYGEYWSRTEDQYDSDNGYICGFSHQNTTGEAFTTGSSKISTYHQVYMVKRAKNGIFGNKQISNGPITRNNSTYEWTLRDHWNYTSVFNAGIVDYYSIFRYEVLNELYSGNYNESTNIENTLSPFGDWVIPTRAEWHSIYGNGRHGSIVNGYKNVVCAFINVPDVVHMTGKTTQGLLLFPDNEIINGKILKTYVNSQYITSTAITEEELNKYLNQGCQFIPISGYQVSSTEQYNAAFYWTSECDPDTNGGEGLGIEFYDGTFTYNDVYPQNYSCPARCIREYDEHYGS